MKNIKCKKCHVPNAKLEGNTLIIRTGYGKKKSFHALDIIEGTMTCWNCGDIIHIYNEIRRIKNDVERKSVNDTEQPVNGKYHNFALRDLQVA